MTREEIERGFVGAGWEIVDRSSPQLLVGRSGHLSILAYEFLTRTEDPSFELIDSERMLVCWVRVIPTPRIAGVLLEQHGEPLVREQGSA